MSRLVDQWGTFTALPNSVIKMWPQIGVDGIALFLYLRYRTNSETEVAFPKYDTIQKDTTLTRTRIAKAARALEAAGVLERKRRFGGSTIYTLKRPDGAISPPVGLMEGAPLVHLSDSISPPVGPSLVHLSHTNKTELSETKPIETEKDSPVAAPASDTKAIQAQYEALLGYKLGKDWVKGESTAAKAMAQKWTPAQLAIAYNHYKADPFWSDKRLSLAYLLKQMPEYFRNGATHNGASKQADRRDVSGSTGGEGGGDRQVKSPARVWAERLSGGG